MSNGNTLYLECRSGISGDMTVAALLDLGATEENLRAELAKLPVDGYEIQVKKIVKSGLLVSDFDVILEHEVPAHTHEHSHMHPHVHRSWAGIEKMLLESDLKPRVKALSLQMFRTVAEAEAKVHGHPVDEVHFHEVGAVDSIVDIVGTAACLDELNVDKVVVSELTEGCGHIRCQHGVLPVPVPAVLEIAAAHHLTFHQIEQAYLSTAPVVRVRQEDDTYYLTYKSKGLMAREEYNLPLTKESYEHLRSKADGRILTKKRYLIPMEGTEYTIELDIFLGEYEGLKLAEVEFPSEEAALAFVPPEWFGREVTFTGEYQNSRLVLAENLVLKTKE